MKRLLFGTILALVLVAAQVGTVFAQEVTPTNTGTVQSVALETDATGAVTAVVVTYTDGAGATQTVSLTLADATAQGLVSTDAAGVTTVNDGVAGLPVTVPEATPTDEEDQHPVGGALADFFGDLLGVDYDTIMSYHNGDNAEGGHVGFGVIAQALWLSHELDGGTETFTALLDAKQNGDYSDIKLADGSTPDNWGDVVKSMKKGDNLGSVKSGHAVIEEDTGATGEGESTSESDGASTDGAATDAEDQGSGNDNNGNGHGNGGNSHHGHGHGHGHGHP